MMKSIVSFVVIATGGKTSASNIPLLMNFVPYWQLFGTAFSFDSANAEALLGGKSSINLAKIFLFVMLGCHAKATCNDNVRDAVDHQQCADVGSSGHLRHPGSHFCS